MKGLLSGKVAIITGASKGIGRALAIGFAAEGALVCCVARTEALLNSVVDEIHQAGGQALAVVADVTREAEVQAMVRKTVEHFGKLDILVANAGGSLDNDVVEESDSDSWRETIDLNLTSVFYCAKAAIPHLKRNGAGKIITIGSGLGHRGMEKRSAYACAKAGLWMLTRVLAQELQADNISVNELIPGPVATGKLSAAFRERFVEKQGEWVKQPEDVVTLALFLASQPDFGPTAQSFSLMRRDN
jgi:3-oxoacyl-[acyl-carrier protein] reductase